jgi:mannose-6-phosphate isomerase-like protein (cupin superfamily)
MYSQETSDKKQVIVTRNRYRKVKQVSWEDVKLKMTDEIKQKSGFHINRDTHSFVCHNEYLPGTLKSAYEEVGMKVMHIYVSLSDEAETFGRHNDLEDVLIVQSIGKMMYVFDNGNICTLRPGDSIFIPKGVFHTPIVSESRVTLSFSS